MTSDKKALLKVAQAATQSEWRAFVNVKTNTFAIHTPDDERCGNIIDWMGFDGVDMSKTQKAKNAKFIAAFNPMVAQALLGEIAELEAEVSRLKGSIEGEIR